MEPPDRPYAPPLLPDPPSGPPRRRQGRQASAAAGADLPPAPCGLRIPHSVARGGFTVPLVPIRQAIQNPHPAVGGGASMSTPALRKARTSKKASGAGAAQLPHAAVQVHMAQRAPASAQPVAGDIDMDDAHHVLEEMPPRSTKITCHGTRLCQQKILEIWGLRERLSRGQSHIKRKFGGWRKRQQQLEFGLGKPLPRIVVFRHYMKLLAIMGMH
ncbi:unnamed protein product [Urochloa decumbens]|uniref:Uncharacterized protein n=1 Tax=Urochloa decumbens TaxID=240449 RepID=A0ABC8XCI2_9POAL